MFLGEFVVVVEVVVDFFVDKQPSMPDEVEVELTHVSVSLLLWKLYNGYKYYITIILY